MGKAKVNLNSVTKVGLDLAKHVFQIRSVDVDGRIVITFALRRKDVLSLFGSLPPCIIGLEACGSAHHWARELVKLGHDARELRGKVGDGVSQAADFISAASSIPSLNFTPSLTFGNWFLTAQSPPGLRRRHHQFEHHETHSVLRQRALHALSDRVGLTNQIGAVLATLGVNDYNPLLQSRRRRLAELRTGLDEPIPPNALAKIERLLASCLVPGFDGASLSNDWKDALWAKFFMGASQRQSGCVPRQAFRGRHGV